MTQKNKTSLLVSSQLPEFIRDSSDYSKFIAFLEAYYEWMEQNNNVLDTSRNLKTYMDVDNTTDQFMNYFIEEFLPYWPEGALLDKNKAVKYARQFYQKKGTPSAYQFLFRVLYNSDFDVLYTKDSVLRASSGSWYVAKSLKLASLDDNFLNTQNLRLFGETTKSIATIEKAIKSSDKTEIFISDIQRLFQSGEFVRVVDSNNQDVLFGGQPLRAKIVGQLSQVKIDPQNRGLLYQVGNPVIVHGGLNSEQGVGAVAQVSQITTGAIQHINLVDGGYGYRLNPNTNINITGTNPGSQQPIVIVGSINPDQKGQADVSFIPKDIISLKRFITIGNTNYNFSNLMAANANTKLSEAFSFDSFSTFPLSSVLVLNGGGGISQIPQIYADSTFSTDLPGTPGHLKSLGILAPIQIINSGLGYEANDVITFTDGSGHGANAIISSVNAEGSILTVQYVPNSDAYSVGGRGYRSDALPALNIVSANTQAYGAELYLPGILGDGATFSTVVDRVGSITSISLTNAGEDYIATPNVSLKVQDIVVSNVNPELLNVFNPDNVIYQGDNGVSGATYFAYYHSLTPLRISSNTQNSLWNLRVYDYNSYPEPNKQLKLATLGNTVVTPEEILVEESIRLNMANTAFDSTYNTNGIRTFGDGSAIATASFLNGLVISQGQYLNNRGQPSSYDKLQSEIYNNYTYIITVEKEIAKYRDILLNLLHPTGMRVLGRYAMKADAIYNYNIGETSFAGYKLSNFTGYPGTTVTITTDFDNKSNNIVTFNNLAGANIGNFLFANSILHINPTNGPFVYGEIESVDALNNQVTLKNNVWLTFSNVAYVTATSGTNEINISSLTDSYDIINNGNYTDANNPLKDIVFAGDTIKVGNTISNVLSVNYNNDIIYLDTVLTENLDGLMSVKRAFETNQIEVYGQVGETYSPQLTDELGNTLTTEDNRYILLG